MTYVPYSPYENEMSRDELIAEVKALRVILTKVANDTNWREINGTTLSPRKPITEDTYYDVTAAIWGDGGCPRRVAR